MRPTGPMRRGRFCVFEGIDGSGKSTLVAALGEALRLPAQADLRSRFAELHFLREPTRDTEAGRRIRRILEAGEAIAPEEWLALFIEDRATNVARNIRPALEGGGLVLQDRYVYSTAAYQASADRSPTAILQKNFAQGFPEPDDLFYLELPVATALGRIRSGRSRTESFETEQQLSQIAVHYARILPAGTIRIDATRPTREQVDLVLAHLRGVMSGSG